MNDKCVMVDLDNTLVDFTSMFFHYIKDNFGYDFDGKELKTYDFAPFFKSKGLEDEEIRKFFVKLYNEPHFYKDYLTTTPEYFHIMTLLNYYKKQGYDIELHTKCSTDVMIESKIELLKNKIGCEHFDILTLELIKGKEIITSTKKSHYGVIIDDSPSVVEHYLKENQEGIVYLPIRNYNLYLVNKYKERIRCIL